MPSVCRKKLMRPQYWRLDGFSAILPVRSYFILGSRQYGVECWPCAALNIWLWGSQKSNLPILKLSCYCLVVGVMHSNSKNEHIYLLGPLTPSQISLSRSSNDALTIWITNSKSLVDQPFSVWPTGLQKFDLFFILNFPSLFFDWSIQNFWESISQKFWIDQSEKR